ncbi:MAG TPA: WG repeat-containing protein [Casimicrobiaceae bacterium]|nr:WG repeat-containing protein [Casimicrobiaceae bacterium]
MGTLHLMTLRRLARLLACGSVVLAAPLACAQATFADAGLYLIRDGDLIGLIDRAGKVVLAPDKFGYIDRSGKVVIAPVYSYARPYERGLAFVLDKGKSMFIDERGNVVWSKP